MALSVLVAGLQTCSVACKPIERAARTAWRPAHPVLHVGVACASIGAERGVSLWLTKATLY